jgi:hypothetical protein
LNRYIHLIETRGLWCPLRQIYFPQIFGFVGRRSDDSTMPIRWLYTLDPDAAPRAKATIRVPIVRIDPEGAGGRRVKSLVLRHHENLDMALGYLNGVEDVVNTCDLSDIFASNSGYFTLLLRSTKPEWPGPLIFYVAESRGDGIQRFEVAVGADGKAHPTDLLGTD